MSQPTTPVPTERVKADEPQVGPGEGPLGQDVLCPLCDYNLRGLTEPRCPECGYAFDWASLLDARLKPHPYLFEHHPRRNFWSFWRTLVGGLRPRRFWSSLKPAQPSRPGRLLLYWIVATLLLAVGYAAYSAQYFVRAARRNEANRASYLRLVVSSSDPYFAALASQYGSPQALVDRAYPPTLSKAFAKAAYSYDYRRTDGGLLVAALAYIVWPWLTFATLMIFRASMNRAMVKKVHVLRCVVYSCDAAMWLAPVVAIVVPPLAEDTIVQSHRAFPILAALIFAAYTAWRLAPAYELYLKFDRPWATAIAAQMIVLLLSAVVALNL